MKIMVILIAGVVFLSSCTNSGLGVGNWIDTENEKELLVIKEENDRLWLQMHNRQMTINTESKTPFVTIRNQEIPIQFNPGGDTLTFLTRSYIPLENSLKGRFTGRWKSSSGDTVLLVQLDENSDLTWDIIRKEEKPVRFWPKRTSNGFHFSLGEKVLSYEIKDGYILDRDGNKYFRESDI